MCLLAGGDRYPVHWVADGINLVVVNEVKNQRHDSSRLRTCLPVVVVTVVKVIKPVADCQRLHFPRDVVPPARKNDVVDVVLISFDGACVLPATVLLAKGQTVFDVGRAQFTKRRVTRKG